MPEIALTIEDDLIAIGSRKHISSTIRDLFENFRHTDSSRPRAFAVRAGYAMDAPHRIEVEFRSVGARRRPFRAGVGTRTARVTMENLHGEFFQEPEGADGQFVEGFRLTAVDKAFYRRT